MSNYTQRAVFYGEITTVRQGDTEGVSKKTGKPYTMPWIAVDFIAHYEDYKHEPRETRFNLYLTYQDALTLRQLGLQEGQQISVRGYIYPKPESYVDKTGVSRDTIKLCFMDAEFDFEYFQQMNGQSDGETEITYDDVPF